jgi:hypothetical protein
MQSSVIYARNVSLLARSAQMKSIASNAKKPTMLVRTVRASYVDSIPTVFLVTRKKSFVLSVRSALNLTGKLVSLYRPIVVMACIMPMKNATMEI